MTSNDIPQSTEAAENLRQAKELRSHLAWLDSFTPLALGVLAIGSGICSLGGTS